MYLVILDLLQSKPNNTHYLNRYYNFIRACDKVNSSKSKEELGYCESHHILPKSKDMFPEYKSFKDYPENKITLTYRQHFISHWMLWKAYSNQSTAYSFRSMAAGQNNPHQKRNKSKNYELAKKITKETIGGSKRGRASYRDTLGNIVTCRTDDSRVLSGELISLTKDRSSGKRSEEWKAKHSKILSASKYNENKVVTLYFYDIKIDGVKFHSKLFVELLEQGWSLWITKDYRSMVSRRTNANMSKDARERAGKNISLASKHKKEFIKTSLLDD